MEDRFKRLVFLTCWLIAFCLFGWISYLNYQEKVLTYKHRLLDNIEKSNMIFNIEKDIDEAVTTETLSKKD